MKSIWPSTYGFLPYTVKFVCKNIHYFFFNNVKFRNAVKNAYKRDIDFPACDAYSIPAVIIAY